MDAQQQASVERALALLRRLREQGLWPNGRRSLMADSYGLLLLLALERRTGDESFAAAAVDLAVQAEHALGRPLGILREEENGSGQGFVETAMWLYALARLARIEPEFRRKGALLAHEIRPSFLLPGPHVLGALADDLEPCAGPTSAVAPFFGLVAARALDDPCLGELEELLSGLCARIAGGLHAETAYGAGRLLWAACWLRREPWAPALRRRCLRTLDALWSHDGRFLERAQADGNWTTAGNAAAALGLVCAQARPERAARAVLGVSREPDGRPAPTLASLMAGCVDLPEELSCGGRS